MKKQATKKKEIFELLIIDIGLDPDRETATNQKQRQTTQWKMGKKL